MPAGRYSAKLTVTPGPGYTPGADAREAASNVLAALAMEGNDDSAAQQHAYAAAMQTLTGTTVTTPLPAWDWSTLDKDWPVLNDLEPRSKQLLVQAMVAAVRDDGQLTLNEAELLRTACGLLHCPMPAFVA